MPVQYLIIISALVLAVCNVIQAAPLDFNRDIRPILSDKCIGCHGPEEESREADLRFDQLETALEDRGGYAVIKPGEPENSEMMARILSDDEDLQMPPHHAQKELTEQDIAKLKQWIEEGANWEPHWAYVAPQTVPIPKVSNPEWCENLIDSFVMQELDQQKLTPAVDADSITLLRRLCFDLTGLPPTPEMAKQFLNDSSESARSKLIDELLASPHFGERMAMYWLDLVRYADTVGYHGDQDHSISPYRDWVINAFNQDMPFDQFTRAQLAGDLLENHEVDNIIASGYNRLLQTTHEGGLQQKEYLAIYAADRVRNVSEVWMGATMGCAQCHSHKYDPYTITDFYSMAAFFADLDEAKHFTNGGNSLPTRREPELAVLSPNQREERQHVEQHIQELSREIMPALISGDEKISQLLKQYSSAESQLKSIEKSKRLTMISASIKPREMRVLPRGNWQDDSGPIVQSAIPEFLGSLDTPERATRLDLANWLVDAENGSGLLTARVFVNRLWSLMFGHGLADLNDFGGQGSPPTHPGLLDQLAIEFVNSGWDIKHMIKLMANSHTYRQESLSNPQLEEIDPENKLYARQSRFRLPAEMIRDNALAVSGLLVSEYGGPSIKPYQPAGYYRHLNFPQRKYTADTNQQQWRRGVYMHWQRQFLHPMLKAFDAPSREECTAERPRSNTPLAALTLLNDPTFLEAARCLAERILLEGGEEEQSQLNYAYQLALSRQPDDLEQEMLLGLLDDQFQYYQTNPKDAEELLNVGLKKVNTTLPQKQLAAWTQVARVLLNLSEVTTRN